MSARRDAWKLTAVCAIWATSLFVAALWVSGHGIQSVLGLDGETLSSVGRLAGLVSANLLLYQVLLMARVPLFERGFGRDALTRMHRVVGMWSFWLLCAHILLLVPGYALQAGVNPIVQLWQFVWDYPGMLLATAGTALLVMVMVTSARRSRGRLRYESWHLLHLYGYLGVGLAIPHMLWTGADFTASPAATSYWWALWGTTAALVLGYRIIVPILRSLRHGLRVHSVSLDGPRGVTVTMRGRRLARLRAEAGQFFVWRFVDGPGWMRGHPLSLSAAPAQDELTVTARIVGDGTRRLAYLPIGTRVLVEGPFGHLTVHARRGQKLLMIAAGAGIAPLVAILQAASFAPGEATLLTRDHDDDDALRREQVQRLVADRGLVHFTINGPRSRADSPWLPKSHEAWRGPELIRSLAPDIDQYDAYVCGPVRWMRSVELDLRRAGVTADRVHTEAFTV